METGGLFRGVSALRRGESESEGTFNAFGWGGAFDIRAAVRWLASRPEVRPQRIGGLGLSVGGELMLEEAASNPRLRAVVADGAGVRSLRDHLEADDRGPLALISPLVAQTVEPFEPSDEEIEKAKREAATRRMGPPPLTVRLDAARLPATAIDDLKELLGSFPGESEVVLELMLSAGDPRRLRLGTAFKVAPTPTLRAELDQILGPAVVHAPVATAPTAA